MGHASCGGVRAYLDNLFGPVQKSDFIARWMSLLNGARTRALRAATDGEIENQQRAMEHASIQQSLENLMTFPFIKDRVNSRGLKLRGCYFSIADGILLALDPKTDKFSPVG